MCIGLTIFFDEVYIVVSCDHYILIVYPHIISDLLLQKQKMEADIHSSGFTRPLGEGFSQNHTQLLTLCPGPVSADQYFIQIAPCTNLLQANIVVWGAPE